LLGATHEAKDLEHLDSGIKIDRKSTRLNSSHVSISYAVFCLKKKKKIVHSALDRKLSLPEDMLLGYQAALCSLHFLFLTEPVNDNVTAIEHHSVASPTSYFDS